MPSKALAATRQAIDAAPAMTMDEALEREMALQRELGYAHDYGEGVAAFAAKRAPAFSDR
jgi:2-(1,2-epoxy-1,2-dihydrophenyl)acetyl-CoA isomerase